MELLKELIKHWDSVLLVLLAAGGTLFMLLHGKKQLVYRMLYALVTEAEKRFGKGTGSLKQAYVLQKLYEALPGALRIFLPYGTVVKMIETALTEAKKVWAQEAGVEVYVEQGAENAEGMWKELSDGKGEE